MGKSQSKIEFKRLKHSCDQLFQNTRNFLHDPNDFTKRFFLASIKIAKTEIDIFVQANENSNKVNNEIKLALKFVSTVFDKDFSAIRNFNGHYDDDFFQKCFNTLSSLNDLNLLIMSRLNMQNIDVFKDNFRRAFLNLFLWFTASSLRVDDLPEAKINNVLAHLNIFQNKA